MSGIVSRPDWYLPERAATDEDVFFGRREFLRTMGLGGMMVAGAGCGASETGTGGGATSVLGPELIAGPDMSVTSASLLPSYMRNPSFSDAGRALTEEHVGTTFNNFYEFTFGKNVASVIGDFKLDPYTLAIDGLVEKPMTLGLADIEKLGYEERVYRFRCVEIWSMTVPWLGVPLKKLVELARPLSSAKYVAFKSFFDPEQAPNHRERNKYEWPYYEGLRIDEAMNELGFVTTGAYGKRLLPQSGTPLRIVLPWKYGYKGPKSIVRMTFTDKQPPTFWDDAVANEYPFYSNVDPQSPHPRWSQAEERFITDKANKADVEVIPTQWCNGYAEQVAHLYKDMPRKLM